MEINIGMSECHKNVDNYYGSHITVWIPRCAGREAFDGVEPLPEYQNKYKKFEKVTLSNCNKILVVTKKDIPYAHFYAKVRKSCCFLYKHQNETKIYSLLNF